MRKHRFFAFLLLFSGSVFASDPCSDVECPNGREPSSLCIVDPSMTSLVFKFSAYAGCGYSTEIVTAKNDRLVMDALAKFAKECKSLDRLSLFGHGFEVITNSGGQSSNTVGYLLGFSCLFNKGAKIEYLGCNVGRGCEGDMLLYRAASRLLKQGGSVTAPTYYSATVAPGIIPHTSLNFKNRVLNFNPAGNPVDSWTQSGLATSDGGTINENCHREMDELIRKATVEKAKAEKKGCLTISDPSEKVKMISYQTLKDRVKDPDFFRNADTLTWVALRAALKDLKRKKKAYQDCSGGSELRPSVDVVQ